MALSAIQFKARRGDLEGSTATLLALCERAAAAGARVIVCPEMALTGYLFPSVEAAARVAEPADGPTSRRFGDLARRHGAYVVIGYPEATAERGVLYNSALVLGPDGTLLANYRKRLLYRADLPWAQPGDQPYPQIETPYGLLTVGICMDMNDDRFVHHLRRAAVRARGQGSRLLCAFCTNWTHQGYDIRPYWAERVGAGADLMLLAANTYGWELAPGCPPTAFLGASAIMDHRPGRPPQTLALAAETGDEVLVAEPPGPVSPLAS